MSTTVITHDGDAHADVRQLAEQRAAAGLSALKLRVLITMITL